jgi:hypothetical protein
MSYSFEVPFNVLHENGFGGIRIHLRNARYIVVLKNMVIVLKGLGLYPADVLTLCFASLPEHVYNSKSYLMVFIFHPMGDTAYFSCWSCILTLFAQS